MDTRTRLRSNLPQADLRRHYQDLGGLVALNQIKRDSKALDEKEIAVGPFARIDAGEVAAREGKTRGAISNLFGNQAAYQVSVMERSLDAEIWGDAKPYPLPDDHGNLDAWVDAFFLDQAMRGPQHGAEPELNYAWLWTLWLGTIPYGMWSERVATPSLREYAVSVDQIEAVFKAALAHFNRSLRPDVTLSDLATGAVSLTEGAWLNQCLTRDHPINPGQSIDTMLVSAGRMLFRGAVTA